MKKLIAIFTSVLMLCAMLPLGAVGVSAATSGTTGDCTWTQDNNGHLTISGNGKMEDYSCQYIDGVYRTTAPWGWAVASVTIEDGVTTIGEQAFRGCRSLTTVTIPDSVTNIGAYAFYNCDNLVAIDVDENNPNYRSVDGALFNKETTILIQYPSGKSGAYSVPDSVITIGAHAFDHCRALTSVSIGDSVTTIEDSAIVDCGSLTSVTIGDSVTTIGNYAFYGCPSLTSVSIGDSVTTIGVSAFYYCTSLTSVSIPDSVTTIGAHAFRGCKSLTSVTIGDSVTSIGRYAFGDCASLTDIYYTGSDTDRAAIRIDADGNEKLLNATWHYADDPIADTVTHSVMETENGNGLAFRFELAADGVSVKNRIEADLTNATVNYLGKDCKLLGMGAVLTNNATIGSGKFTLEDVNDSNVLDIPAVYLQEVDEDSCAFATRIIDIPDTALERTIYARPYYVVEVDGEEIVVYGDVDSASCAEYM